MQTSVFSTGRLWNRALVLAAIAVSASSAVADLAITNGDFQATTAQSTDIVSWSNYIGADPGAWWLSAWQGPVVSFNGTSVFGLSGDTNTSAWAYQSVGLNNTSRTNIDLQFDVGMFSDAGETRDLGVMVQLFQTDGTFVGVDNTDIVGAAGVTLIDSKSTTTGAMTASQFQRKTLNLNLSTANATGEFFLRFSNFNGGTGVGDPWTMIDNVKFITAPPHVPVNLTWVGLADGGTWDMGTSAHFNTSSSVASTFLEGDRPTFGNSGAVNGQGVSVVNVAGSIDSGSVVINSNHDYVFQGTGGVNALDGGTLVKSGSGKLTLANESGNNFTGGVTIQSGVVELTGFTNGNSHGIAGGNILNNGTIISNRQYTDPAAINEWNPLFLTQEISGSGNIIIKNHTFLGEAGVGPKNNTFTGAVTIEAGFVYLADVNGLGSTTAGTTVLSGATLAVVDGWHLGDDAVIAEPLTLNGLGATTWFGGNFPSGALFAWEGHRTFTGAVNLASTSAIHTRGTSVLELTGPLTAAAGAGLEKHGDGTLKIGGATLESITVYGGALHLASGTTKTKSVTIEAGTVDLRNASLAVDYTGATSYDDLLSKIGDATIMTSMGTNYVVGIIDNATLGSPVTSFGTPSVTVDATTVLLRGTLKGDANLSGSVTFDDLLLLAQNYDAAGTNKRYSQGDTNYDGVVNFDDLLALAQNYGLSALSSEQQSVLGADFVSDFRAALSLVPEPASLTLVLAASTIGRRRRAC